MMTPEEYLRQIEQVASAAASSQEAQEALRRKQTLAEVQGYMGGHMRVVLQAVSNGWPEKAESITAQSEYLVAIVGEVVRLLLEEQLGQ